MPLTCSCKKCGREVPPSDVCTVCGSKLNPSQAHVTWKIVRTPVKDWMCWNAVMRIILPVLLLVLAIIVWMESLSGGLAGVENLVSGGFLTVIGVILAAAALVVLIVLLLRGQELLICSIDSKGMHIERYLPHPSTVRLLARLKPPALMDDAPNVPLLLDRADVTWKQVQRIQLWPEKSYIILYAPAWWQCMAMPAAPLVWNDALEMIRQKVGKRKDLILPPGLRDDKPSGHPKAASPKPERATRHARPFEGMEEQNIPQKPVENEPRMQ